MGHIVHHAIVVTSWNQDLLYAARDKAHALGCSASEVIESAINSDYTFLIGPDGSKSGWEHDGNGDAQRNAWIEWANRQRYGDGSTSLQWVEVEYGNDDAQALIRRHAWDSAASSEGEKKA